MPELPEVETIVRDLRRLVSGATILRTAVLRPDLIAGDVHDFEERTSARTIDRIDRRAKNIVITLGDDRLIINLGMTGRVLVQAPGEPEPTHLGVRFELSDERRMLYQDVRRFGRLTLLSDTEWEARSERLGVEPLSADFTAEHLYRLTRQSRMAIKPWMMDQKRVVGVGNIYASEALFRARVSPRKAARRITRREAAAIHDAVQEVLTEAIDFRGTTLADYRDASGDPGGFSLRLAVYDREGEPCPSCGSPIRKIVQAGRSTFFCPKCQK